eukprot:Skav233779  [mRNA]  locus=scaffold780:180924:185816:- [translate_table: standard]
MLACLAPGKALERAIEKKKKKKKKKKKSELLEGESLGSPGRFWPGQNALVSFMVGRYAIASEGKTDAQVQADFMARLRQKFPQAPEPIRFIRRWARARGWAASWGSYGPWPCPKGSYTTASGINAQAKRAPASYADELRTLAVSVSASLTLAGDPWRVT